MAVARSPSERVRNVRARSERDKRVRDKLVMKRDEGNNTDTTDRKEQKHQKEKKTHRKKKEKYKNKHREADERPAVAAKKKKSGKKDKHMRRDRVTSRPPAVAGNAREEEPRPPRKLSKPPRSPEKPGVKKVSLSSGSSCPEERSEETLNVLDEDVSQYSYSDESKTSPAAPGAVRAQPFKPAVAGHREDREGDYDSQAESSSRTPSSRTPEIARGSEVRLTAAPRWSPSGSSRQRDPHQEHVDRFPSGGVQQ